MKIQQNKHHEAIQCSFRYGPVFGGCDIAIVNNANTMGNFSDLGRTYSHPQYAFETDEARTFLAGWYQFQLDEIEVFQKEE